MSFWKIGFVKIYVIEASLLLSAREDLYCCALYGITLEPNSLIFFWFVPIFCLQSVIKMNKAADEEMSLQELSEEEIQQIAGRKARKQNVLSKINQRNLILCTNWRTKQAD